MHDLTQAREAMDEARTLLEDMTKTYRLFWDSREPSDLTRTLACPYWGGSPCWYPEMELTEIIRRLTAGPGVLTQEQREITGRRERCDPADRVCLSLLPERTPPADGWQLTQPAGTSGTKDDTERTAIREQVILPDGSLNPAWEAGSATDPTTLYPLFHDPGEIDLSPRP